MTQDVQPLTWQKTTNIEEHQQFFSKINEIIGNLAPTVDEAEQAIAQATAAIASANDAVATANAASAAASAAASQAQTAASTVAGYDGRLTAAEGDITSLSGRMTAAETKNSQQDTAIDALQTADSNNVKIAGTHAIGNYAMLLTDNQNYDGIKRAIKTIVKKANIEGAVLPANYWIDNHLIEVQGNTDNVPIISIGSERRNTGWETRINLNIFGSIDSATKRQNNARIIFSFDEINKRVVMQVGYYNAASGNTTYNDQQILLSW